MAFNKKEKPIPADIYNSAIAFSNDLSDAVADKFRTPHPEDGHIIERAEALQMALNVIGPKVMAFNEENRKSGYMLIQEKDRARYIIAPASKAEFRIPSVDEISVKLSFTSGGTPCYTISTPGAGPGGDRQNLVFYAGNKDSNADPEKGIPANPQPVNLTIDQLVELTANIASAVKETYDSAFNALPADEKPSIESGNRALMKHAVARAEAEFGAKRANVIKAKPTTPRDRF